MTAVQVGELINRAQAASNAATATRAAADTACSEANKAECAAANAWNEVEKALRKLAEEDLHAKQSDLGRHFFPVKKLGVSEKFD